MSALLRRREALGAAGAALVALSGCGGASGAAEPPPVDALGRRLLRELAVFTDWLAEFDARGFVGEVGWPGAPAGDADRWNAAAATWYRAADAAGLWVANWASGEWWGSYPLATYSASRSPGTLDRVGRQAAVVERFPTRPGVLRGVAVAGGAFAFPSADPESRWSNVDPGRIEHEYHFDGAQSLRSLARRGHRLARIEFRWERVQRTPGGALDPAELDRLRAVVAAAGAAGLRVVLDLHNYAGYYLHDGRRGVRREVGSAELPVATLADVWVKLSRAFRDEPAVEALGLMNEPVGVLGAQRWEAASRSVVTALRADGERRTLLVSGWASSGVEDWRATHPRPWVDDPGVRYEAHHYFDGGHDSTYERTYAQELAAAS